MEDLRPWGEGSGAAPLVELDFLIDGQSHRLVKSFLGKKRCTLAVGTLSFDGSVRRAITCTTRFAIP